MNIVPRNKLYEAPSQEVMRLFLALSLLLSTVAFADDSVIPTTPQENNPPQKIDNQQTDNTNKIDENAPQNDTKAVAKIVVEPKLRPTKNWIFVVDNSDSMLDVFHKSLEGFKLVTQTPSDDWKFKLIVFSDMGKQNTFKAKNEANIEEDWHAASPTSFDSARRWANKPQNRGTNSHGLPAIIAALHEPIDELTIVIISDGGLTSACENRGFGTTESTIAKAQSWRSKNGHGMAIITTIGIRNSHYSAFCSACNRNKGNTKHNYSLPDQWQTNKGHKPSDADCQAFMQRLGSTYFGGYVLVENW